VTPDVRALVARLLPGHEVGVVRPLGEGVDNIAYELDGELVVRWSKEGDPAVRREVLQREAALLEVVAAWSTLPVPEPFAADADLGVIVYRKVPGVPLAWHPVAAPLDLAPALGELVARLQALPLERVEHLVEVDDQPLDAWRSDAEACFLAVADELLDPVARRTVEDFLGRPPPAEPDPEARTFCHHDLGAEHLLVDPDTGVLAGVIDWSDAAVADPVHDVARLLRDLGPEVFEQVLDRTGRTWSEAERARAAFYARCALLEDLAYGVRTGERRYADAGLANLHRTFA
jgi:aminoglycoside phosphotransferase (APT) family kinase protein